MNQSTSNNSYGGHSNVLQQDHYQRIVKLYNSVHNLRKLEKLCISIFWYIWNV